MQIFITDWWLCPELYLRRPFSVHDCSRLDTLLEAKAKLGVQVPCPVSFYSQHFLSQIFTKSPLPIVVFTCIWDVKSLLHNSLDIFFFFGYLHFYTLEF